MGSANCGGCSTSSPSPHESRHIVPPRPASYHGWSCVQYLGQGEEMHKVGQVSLLFCVVLLFSSHHYNHHEDQYIIPACMGTTYRRRLPAMAPRSSRRPYGLDNIWTCSWEGRSRTSQRPPISGYTLCRATDWQSTMDGSSAAQPAECPDQRN